MKKIDKLVLSAFVGPFILTFLVVVFILLMQHMLKYFDDIIGKDLGMEVISQLLFYFAIFMTPVALPLAVLLSSLIAFGNLGEHFELTAIKSSGISLTRTLQPIFFFVLMLTGVAFYANNYLVPKAALEAYSLLYDIKQKKPALELKEGAFYNGIPDISIKVNQKFSDDESALKEIIVYDHTRNDGNKEVTVADSGRMYTIMNERYLKFELFNGYNYTEGASAERDMTGQNSRPPAESFTRSRFGRTEVVFDLSSYDLKRTDKKWFEGNRIMRNLTELDHDIDSMNTEILKQRLSYYKQLPHNFAYFAKGDSLVMPAEVLAFEQKQFEVLTTTDSSATESSAASRETVYQSIQGTEEMKTQRRLRNIMARRLMKPAGTDTASVKKTVESVDALYSQSPPLDMIQAATNMARQVKSQIDNSSSSLDLYEKESAVFYIQWHKIIASSLACIAMFLIGAPLGAIIKRGGLGVPFLVSIFFFIVYYLLTMQGEKLAKQETVTPWFGVWAADFILLAVGLFFLKQARVDARFFEADFYSVMADRFKNWLRKRGAKKALTA